MVVPVGYDELAYAIDRHSSQAIKLAFSAAVSAELLGEDAIRVEHLDSVVARIGHHDAVIRTHGYAARPRETSGLAPPTSDFEQLASLLEVLAPRGGTCRCCETCENPRNITLQVTKLQLIILLHVMKT